MVTDLDGATTPTVSMDVVLYAIGALAPMGMGQPDYGQTGSSAKGFGAGGTGGSGGSGLAGGNGGPSIITASW